MERTIEYLKNLKEDVEHVVESLTESGIVVDSNDARHVDEALEDISTMQMQLEAYKSFVNSCQYASEGDVSYLRKLANDLIKGDRGVIDYGRVLRN